jgi:hypothetical protein
MIKTLLIVITLLLVPGIVMGLVSSYRAGQRPHRDLCLILKKFAQQKK